MNPETEGSITCGFYNGLIGDKYPRRYDSSQMSEIFNGIINDGIFQHIGDKFIVTALSGNTVTVGTGKCWFNSTWTENDAPFNIDCGESNTVLNRIDAVVIEVNKSESVRDNTIKLIQGVPSSNPVRPALSKDNNVYQYILCEIYREAGSKEITQSNITNYVGTSEAPFITGILETVNIDELLLQWQDQWDEWFWQETYYADMDVRNFIYDTENNFNEWYDQMKALMEDAITATNSWTDAQQKTILAWFDSIKNQLSKDAATNLQLHMDKSDIERILMVGLVDGKKTISEDGSVITTVDTKGRKLVKTFTDNFSKCTIVLTSEYGAELGRLVKATSSDGSTITSNVAIHLEEGYNAALAEALEASY